MVIGDRVRATKDKERTVPLNDDPAAVADEQYWSDFERYTADHPMTGPTPDEYELDQEDTGSGDPR